MKSSSGLCCTLRKNLLPHANAAKRESPSLYRGESFDCGILSASVGGQVVKGWIFIKKDFNFNRLLTNSSCCYSSSSSSSSVDEVDIFASNLLGRDFVQDPSHKPRKSPPCPVLLCSVIITVNWFLTSLPWNKASWTESLKHRKVILEICH